MLPERPCSLAYLDTQQVVLEQVEHPPHGQRQQERRARAHDRGVAAVVVPSVGDLDVLLRAVAALDDPGVRGEAGDAAAVVGEQTVCQLHDGLPPP